jgi:hypothetical protein
MARLPNSANAILDLRKIADYCLSPVHPRGRHKARLFRELLGISQFDAPWLRETLLESIHDHDAFEIGADTYGSRWRVDVPVARQGTSVMVRTIWIVRSGEDVPRFVTCWVL